MDVDEDRISEREMWAIMDGLQDDPGPFYITAYVQNPETGEIVFDSVIGPFDNFHKVRHFQMWLETQTDEYRNWPFVKSELCEVDAPEGFKTGTPR